MKRSNRRDLSTVATHNMKVLNGRLKLLVRSGQTCRRAVEALAAELLTRETIIENAFDD